MLRAFHFWPFLAISVAITGFAIAADAQSPPPVSITSAPTGLRPMGIAVSGVPVTEFSTVFVRFAVVANSGDNSVSIFVLSAGPMETRTLTPLSVETGIPSPYAAVACGGRDSTVLVTSPSDNSVRVLRFAYAPIASVAGGVAGRVPTGPQPHSVACIDSNLAVVSNVGDNSLSVINPSSLTVRATIPGVPASRGLHGIAVAPLGTVWVASTDANVVSVVNLSTSRVVTQIPVSRPTAVVNCLPYICVASAEANSIMAFDPATVSQANDQFQSVPNPQDLVFSALGNFAISGPDSLWKFDLTSVPRTAGPVATIPGVAALAFVPPSRVTDAATPSNTLVLATSTTTNNVYLIQQAPAFVRNFIPSNGASFDQARTAPGSLASALSVPTGASQAINASFFGEPLPKTLAGVTLKIGGSLSFNSATNTWQYSSTGAMDAPLHFVGPNQVNFQVPTGIALGTNLPAQLTKPDGSTPLTILNITPTAPGIFSVSQDGRFQGAVLNDDFSQNGLPQLIVGAKPARRGSVIAIFATGGGETNPPMLPGEPAPASGDPLILTRVQPTVTIGGVEARVLFSGMAPGYVGLWQINAEVPASVTPGPAVSLTITAGGVTSNTVTIPVE